MKLIPFEISKYYHFHNRGNNKENIFFEEANYYYFLDLIKKYLTPIIDLYAYCLLPNHFHLVFKIKDNNELPTDYKNAKRKLHLPFSNMFNAYTKAFNKKHDRSGSLFKKHPTKHIIETENYWRNLILYVNTNPDHHNIADSLTYKYSSYQALISDKTTLLKRNVVIDLFEDVENFIFMHKVKRINIELINNVLIDDE